MCADLCKKAEMVSLSDSDVNLHPTALYEECSYSDEEASLPNEEKEYCFACGCDIIECSELHEGEPALFCEGKHQQWAHARCFNINDDTYKALRNSSEPWICPACSRTNNDVNSEGAKSESPARIASLENTVCSLQQELRDERAQRMNEKKVLQQQIDKLEARLSIIESCCDLCSTEGKPTSPKRKKKLVKKKRKGRQKNTTPVGNENTTDDSNSDTGVSISIPTTNRFDPLAVCGSEASTESDHAEKEESHQESSAPLFKCPTVRYIWGTRSTTTETEVENAIAQLGVNRVSFRIERRESTSKGKHVWYFALLADQGTIEQITSLWTLPWKITTPSQPSSGSQSFLYNSPNAQPPSFLCNRPNLQPPPFLFNRPNVQPPPFLHNCPNAKPPPIHFSNHHPNRFQFQFVQPYPHCQMSPVPFNHQVCQSHTPMNLVNQRMRKMPVPLLPVGAPRA